VQDDSVDQAVEVEYESEENGELTITLGFFFANIYEKCYTIIG